MIIGKLNQIHKDHKAWLSEIEFFNNEISILGKRIQNEAHGDNQKFQNDLDHHRRLLDKLKVAIKSHQAFLYELAHDDIDSLEMLDLEGHNRNKLHFQNLTESFKKLRLHINDSKIMGKLEIH
jgi:hypothetical protein